MDASLTSLPNHKIVDFSELKVLTTDGKPDAITVIESVYRRAENTTRKEENASLPTFLFPHCFLPGPSTFTRSSISFNLLPSNPTILRSRE